jgi:hypothetical protein
MPNVRVLSGLMGLLLLSVTTAHASPVAVPAAEGQHGASHLEVNVVSYDGATNGAITIEVKNNGKSAETFVAQGLFFVPDGDANHAPQRLGAVGPFQIQGDEARKEKVVIPAGGRIVARLDVYCIDSHRSSPSSATKFHMSAQRMPAPLAADINKSANDAAQSYGGVSAPAAKSAVQSEVWKNRDKKWIPLEGEGRQEATKSR